MGVPPPGSSITQSFKSFKSYPSICSYVFKTFESFPLRCFAHFKDAIERCTAQSIKVLFLLKLQVLSNHCGPGNSSNDVGHYKLFSAIKRKCASRIRNVLIEIWSVYEFQEMVDFDCIEPDLCFLCFLVHDKMYYLDV